MKFKYGSKQLWHTRDRSREEVLLSKRVSVAVKLLRTRAVEKGVLTQGHRWVEMEIGSEAGCG